MNGSINREKTIAHLKKRLIETAINNTGVRALCDSIFADIADNRIEPWINEIPNAEVEPVKRGKWVKNENGTWSCSICQSWIPDENHYYARYCLYCGAKMDSAEM